MSATATLLEQIDAIKANLTMIDRSEHEAVKFAAAHALRPLRYAMNADGLPPGRRKECKGAYQMLCAAFGIEEDAA